MMSGFGSGGKNRMSKERDKNLNPVDYFGGVPILPGGVQCLSVKDLELGLG